MSGPSPVTASVKCGGGFPNASRSKLKTATGAGTASFGMASGAKEAAANTVAVHNARLADRHKKRVRRLSMSPPEMPIKRYAGGHHADPTERRGRVLVHLVYNHPKNRQDETDGEHGISPSFVGSRKIGLRFPQVK